MNNQEAAKMFIESIKELASKEDNLYNLECYLSQHFNAWFIKYANTPEGLISEIKSFATMKI